MEPGDGSVIAAWRYPPPYDIYNDDHGIVDDPALATAPELQFMIVDDGTVIGSCSFGADARVPGVTYREGPLDVGIGMRPDLVGRGNGRGYLGLVLAFARDTLGGREFRATIAELNARAIRLCEHL